MVSFDGGTEGQERPAYGNALHRFAAAGYHWHAARWAGRIAARAVGEVLGEEGVGSAAQSSGVEDFGWYTEETPGFTCAWACGTARVRRPTCTSRRSG
ncbi:hypothetical protein [Corynebacterium liangguodongii]|uniref:hypothetical protein n=1 Tax=Corynebacterium liangguodongii TaxID=2079535 RepID=UPI0015CFDB5C|nr:hypothetical protein [Corynebacterium liangguodongii]